MAVIYPDLRKKRVVFASKAEEQVYQVCMDLPKGWIVYYSCTLSSFEQGKGLQDNEIDFVLYHPKWGLFIIEVKGGQIKYDAGEQQFYSVNRHGKSFAIRNPFQQALIWKSRFLRYMKKRHLNCPATHLVCFPTVNEADIKESTEVEPRLLIGKSRLQRMCSYLQEVAKSVHPEKYFNFKDIASELDEILRGATYETRLYISDYLENHETKLKDVEIIHESLLTPVAGSRRLAVEGEAGTGKTMLAILLAKKFRNEGKSVLLLSSNPLLNNFMKSQVGDKVQVQTYAEFASSYGVDLLKAAKDFQASREDWVQYEGPERLKNAILESNIRYSVLLCDEAQDVQPFWWESLEASLQDEDSNFYIFFDRSQGVFGSGSQDNHFVPEDVLPIEAPYFPLVHNYRTTREISGFSRAFRTGKEILKSHSARLGYLPKIIVYNDEEDARIQLKGLVETLFEKEGLSGKDVTVLSARRPFHKGSVFQSLDDIAPYKFIDLGALKRKTLPSPAELEGKLPICTISSFKGLETSVGIITNLSEYNLPLTNPIMASLLYVACTRAKHLLYVMVRKGDQKEAIIRAALATVKSTGALIANKHSVSNEFVGKVSYYDPQRVGWLKVEDPAFESSSLMFFPHDVELAQLSQVQVGTYLKFIPRQEGFATIATELKLDRSNMNLAKLSS